MHGTRCSPTTDAQAIDSNREYLFFELERLFHPQVICSGTGGNCSRLEEIIHFLARNQKQEERLMIETGYPMFAAHKRKHKALIRTLNGMRCSLVCGNYDNGLVSGFVAKWMKRHIAVFDKPLSDFLRSSGTQSGYRKSH